MNANKTFKAWFYELDRLLAPIRANGVLYILQAGPICISGKRNRPKLFVWNLYVIENTDQYVKLTRQLLQIYGSIQALFIVWKNCNL